MPHDTAFLKTPPALKWLLNERAALEGALLVEQKAIAHLQARISVLEQRSKGHEDSAGRLRVSLGALDASISLMHPEVGSSRPAPVQAWKGKYGVRGGLRDFVLSRLREAAPGHVVTSVVTNQIAAHFGWDISMPTLRARVRDSVKRTLGDFAQEGLVERLPTKHRFDAGLWRLRQASPLDQLRALAGTQASGHDPPVDAAGGQVDRQ